MAIAILAAVAAQPALALEKCTGADGKVTYSDRGCATGARRGTVAAGPSTADVIVEYYDVAAPGGHRGRADWHLSYKFSTRTAPGGACAVQDLSTELKLKMRVPRWTPQPGAAPGLATRWQAYLAALETHEHGHLQQGRNLEAAFRGAARSMQAESCGALSAALQARFDALLEQARQRDTEYDRQTNHGATQGAYFQ